MKKSRVSISTPGSDMEPRERPPAPQPRKAGSDCAALGNPASAMDLCNPGSGDTLMSPYHQDLGPTHTVVWNLGRAAA